MKVQKKKKQQQHTPTELERVISFIFIENPGNEHVGRSELKRNSKDKIRLQKQIISHECVYIYITTSMLKCKNSSRNSSRLRQAGVENLLIRLLYMFVAIDSNNGR